MMMRTLGLLTLVILLLGCQPKPQPKTPALAGLEAWLAAEHEADRFHGSVVVGNREGILYEKHVGLANRGWGIPIDSTTRFDMASLNKSFVGALMLLAQQAGKLHVSDRLVDRLSSFSYSGQFHPDITLHDMLTHRSGLPDYDGVAEELRTDNYRSLKRSHFSSAEYVDFISQLPPMAAPGERFYYSNFAYHLLSIVLEEVYQMPFDALLQRQICDPLGLEHTFSSTDNAAVHPRVAEGYLWREGAWERNGFIDLTLGRRIFTTGRELYRWGQAMTDDRLLPDSLRQQLYANHLQGVNSPIAYGYGWVPYTPGGAYPMGNLELDRPYIIHGGNTEGYRSLL
ncbi:MAG TPA: hypothetical protein DCR93_36955, partial [Cytophagales bacterium]|nr:hypothetical protein [Cytophagales bacterium]